MYLQKKKKKEKETVDVLLHQGNLTDENIDKER